MHMEKALHGSWSLAIHCSWVKTERAADHKYSQISKDSNMYMFLFAM